MIPNIDAEVPMALQMHLALHLAHRWFAFLEAPGGDLNSHLRMFHPQVRLSGYEKKHIFADDHETLTAWFAAVPDQISSHHIIHSDYAVASNGEGVLNMVVAYQAPGNPGMHGSIISYETRIDFSEGVPRFVALDKTPILSNRRPDYETSWASNRVLSWVHAELGGIIPSDGYLRELLGNDVRQISAHVAVPEGSRTYGALVVGITGSAAEARAVHLKFSDSLSTSIPMLEHIAPA